MKSHLLRFRVRRLDRRESARVGANLELRVDCPTCRADPFMDEYGEHVLHAQDVRDLFRAARRHRGTISQASK